MSENIVKAISVGSNIYNIVDEGARESKQDKLVGTQGKLVGFDSSGNAVAVDPPQSGGDMEASVYDPSDVVASSGGIPLYVSGVVGTLGTAASLDVPTTGNASVSEVVIGSDTRLSDSRTPTSHASSHATAGTDPISPSSIGAIAAPASPSNGQLLAYNGSTSSWGAVDAVAGSYVCTFTMSSNTMTCDKTYSQIVTAKGESKVVKGVYGDYIYDLVECTNAKCVFEVISGRTLSYIEITSSNVCTTGTETLVPTSQIGRTSDVSANDANYTTKMVRASVLLDKTTFDSVTNWNTYLVNGSLAWCYE